MDALVADLIPYHSGPAAEGVSGEFNTLTLGEPIKPPRDWTAFWASIVIGGGILCIIGVLAWFAMAWLEVRDLPDVPAQNRVEAKTELPPPTPEPEPVVAPTEVQVTPEPAPAPPPRRARRTRPRVVAPVVEPPPEPTPDPVVEPPPDPPPPQENTEDWADIDLEQLPDPWADQ